LRNVAAARYILFIPSRPASKDDSGISQPLIVQRGRRTLSRVVLIRKERSLALSILPSPENIERRRAATARLVEAILEDEDFRRELQEDTEEALRRKGY
jgi:hypothetical protein